MKLKRTFLFFRHFFSVLIFIFITSYCMLSFGFATGIHLTLLVWSLYVLCLPAAHGQLLIGYPLYSFFQRSFYIEPFVWLTAVGVNVYTYFFAQQIYSKMLFTHFLHRIISIPNPYWQIIFVSFIATFYNVITSQSYFSSKSFNHIFMRGLLFVVSFFIFFFFSYPDLVLILNAIF